jgi:hypothetical protein
MFFSSNSDLSWLKGLKGAVDDGVFTDGVFGFFRLRVPTACLLSAENLSRSD